MTGVAFVKAKPGVPRWGTENSNKDDFVLESERCCGPAIPTLAFNPFVPAVQPLPPKSHETVITT